MPPGLCIDTYDCDPPDLPLVATDPGWRGRAEARPFSHDDDDGQPLDRTTAAMVWSLMAAALIALGAIIGWLARS